MNWSHATVIILTCDRDKQLVELAERGVRAFWPGINVSILHDRDKSAETELPDDVRDVTRRVPFLRKIFDLPYLAPTDQLYCIDSDCFLVEEPTDWAPAAHLAVPPGSMGSVWLKQGNELLLQLGESAIDESLIFCGGCWSASRAEMFDPNRELAIEYVRAAVKKGYDKTKYPGPVMEQCLLNALWHKTYADCHLSNERYPLYRPNPNMALYHLSEIARSPAGISAIKAYRGILEGVGA